MKYYRHMMAIGCTLAAMASARADVMILEGLDAGTVTTGDLIDDVAAAPFSVAVAEISGLQLTAWSGGADQVVNTTSSSLGINTDAVSDDTDAFEAGELLYLSFSKQIRIDQIDFNVFDAGELFSVTVGGGPALDITYDALANKSSDVFDLSLVVDADTQIALSAGAGSVIGLDGMDITVIPEPATVGLIGLGGLGLFMARKKNRR